MKWVHPHHLYQIHRSMFLPSMLTAEAPTIVTMDEICVILTMEILGFVKIAFISGISI